MTVLRDPLQDNGQYRLKIDFISIPFLFELHDIIFVIKEFALNHD